MNIYDAVAAVVAVTNGDVLGVEKDEDCVKGGEARGIAQAWAIK